MEPRKVSGSIGTALAVATGIAGLFGGELTAIPWLRALLVAVAVVSILHVLALLPPQFPTPLTALTGFGLCGLQAPLSE